MQSKEEPGSSPEAASMAILQRQADLVRAGNLADAERLSAELLAALCQYAEESIADDPELQEELVLHAHAEAGEWEQVERLYRARLDRSSETLRYGQACHNLAQFLTLMDRWEEAAQPAALATDAARHEDLPLLLAMRLDDQGRIANACGEHRAALALFDEGLQALETDKLHDLPRVCLLIGSARSHLGLDNLAECEADQRAAWRLLQALSVMRSASGVQGALAHWWRVQAGRCERAGDWQSACDARALVVHYRRDIIQLAETQQIYPLYQALIPLARELLPLADSLSRLGQSEAAEEVLEEARSIRQRVYLPA
jgi:hypothetical protein